MKRNHILTWVSGACLLGVLSAPAQQQKPVSERTNSAVRKGQVAETESASTSQMPAQDNRIVVPRLVKISGALGEMSLSSPVEVTFALYQQEADQEPVWTETQIVVFDKKGHYSVLLGDTQPEGLPVELFSSGEAHWLGVTIQGQPQQPRTLLVSVPYALKAVDADKLAGRSPSDFVLSESLGEQVRQVIQAQTETRGQTTSTATLPQGQPKPNSTLSPQMTAAGPMFPPSSFSGTNSTQIVQVTQNGSGNGLFAQTASSTGGTGVVGIATSTSTSSNQNGVYGQVAGAGAGVVGIGTNPSAGIGIYGQGANCCGVVGLAVAPSGFNCGLCGDGSSSPNGSGVFGSAGQWVGVGGQATAASGGPAFGVWGDSLSTGGTGVAGFEDATSGFTNGVYGQSVSPNGTGVFGFNNASSGSTIGVAGSSASTNGKGVFGITTASSGWANGVYGQSSSSTGNGVVGIATASSGAPNGVFGQTFGPNGNGVLGVNDSNAPIGGSGVVGISNAASGGASGVLGVIHSTSGAGTTGIATASSGFNNGVYGQNASSEGYAVHGDAIASSGPAIGVFGTSTAANGGTGVWGVALANSGGAVGVRGDLESPTASGAAGLFLTLSPTSVAGQFANFSRQGLILQGLSGPFDATQVEVFRVDSSGNLHITGNLTVDGTKSSTAKLQDGREVALYAVESPENWFEDFGSAELRNGVAWVPLDASFAQTVNAAVNYHVFLTANGDSNGLYVARKTPAGFEIREHGGGTSNVAFDYRIVARRRGYEAMRLLQVPERKNLEGFRPPLKMANSLQRVEPVKIIPPIAPALAIPSVPPRPIAPQHVPKISVPVSSPRKPRG